MELVEGIVPLLLVLLLGIAGAGMKLYRDRQEPFDSAKPALVSDETMSVVKLPGGHILFVPATRVSDTHGVAYLPGALVNHLAYGWLGDVGRPGASLTCCVWVFRRKPETIIVSLSLSTTRNNYCIALSQHPARCSMFFTFSPLGSTKL